MTGIEQLLSEHYDLKDKLTISEYAKQRNWTDYREARKYLWNSLGHIIFLLSILDKVQEHTAGALDAKNFIKEINEYYDFNPEEENAV